MMLADLSFFLRLDKSYSAYQVYNRFQYHAVLYNFDYPFTTSSPSILFVRLVCYKSIFRDYI